MLCSGRKFLQSRDQVPIQISTAQTWLRSQTERITASVFGGMGACDEIDGLVYIVCVRHANKTAVNPFHQGYAAWNIHRQQARRMCVAIGLVKFQRPCLRGKSVTRVGSFGGIAFEGKGVMAAHHLVNSAVPSSTARH